MLVAKARLTEIRLPPLKIITSKAFSLTSKYLLIANASRRVLYSVFFLIYEIFIAEKHNRTQKCVFLPNYLDNRNKYITFAV